MNVKKMINEIRDILGLGNKFFIFRKNDNTYIIKQLRNKTIITNEYSVKDLEKINIDKHISDLFKLNGNFIYTDYLVSISENTIYVKERDRNFLIQGIYKSGKEDITNFFNLHGINIISGDNSMIAIADIIDLIWYDTLLPSIYNFSRKKKISEDITNADLSLVKSQFKKVIDSFQPILESIKVIFNNTEYTIKEYEYPNNKVFIEDTFLMSPDLGIYSIDRILKQPTNISYNALIKADWDFISILDQVKSLIRKTLFEKANIINLKTIEFVNNYYLIQIFRYKKDVDDFVEVFNNTSWLKSLIEEDLAKQLSVDSRLQSQWRSLKESLNNYEK